MVIKSNFKSGFVGLIGRTNVGKSTLVNKILNQKIVITSGTAQTTRDKINCILNTKNSQIIFVDCPGFFKPKNLLGKRLYDTVISVISDSDVVVMIVDAAGGIGGGDFFVIDRIKNKPRPRFLLLNKIDLVSKEKIKEEKEKIKDFNCFDHIIEISAKTGENIDKFLKLLADKLPEGPQYFDKNITTDQPIEKIISEILREKLFANLSQELPHSINISVERFDETVSGKGEKLIIISCNIYIEKISQKAIIIGREGNMLKKVGREARLELEDLLKSKVFLELWVKVEKNWTKSELLLDRFGY
ncbi:MAG: GTPase Era [Actinobacteria bacterium RBG_19FT_COMBO_36_27]|nr:MAG: GTPase Era [Actinobacteria bacterium RBG_19FT_COMBO_36_27]